MTCTADGLVVHPKNSTLRRCSSARPNRPSEFNRQTVPFTLSVGFPSSVDESYFLTWVAKKGSKGEWVKEGKENRDTEEHRLRPRTEMGGWAITHPSPLSRQTLSVCWSCAKTSSAFQKSAQLRADEGQFSLFKNKSQKWHNWSLKGALTALAEERWGGGSGQGKRPDGYKYLFGQLLEGKFAVCLSSTHPGGGAWWLQNIRTERQRRTGRPTRSSARKQEFDCFLYESHMSSSSVNLQWEKALGKISSHI